VTEISAYTNFYKAEEYHQNYYRLNPNQGYCRMIVKPKVEKVREVFSSKLKKPE
jgi:peptide methionine sulfoxide reductase MsrA